jgi:hypothetical protein
LLLAGGRTNIGCARPTDGALPPQNGTRLPFATSDNQRLPRNWLTRRTTFARSLELLIRYNVSWINNNEQIG